jgi:Inner membrane component of T3SS, cytoplasmic domain
MNAPIVVQLLRFGFLALLWIFIFATLRVIRADLFGVNQARAGVPGAATRPPAPRPKPKRRGRAASQLVVTEGGLTGTRITLGEQPIMIGRANDSTLVLTDDYASSRHARLTSREGEWYVEDLGSTNGTYLDRTRVAAPTLVPAGVPIRIGKTVLELRS